MTYYIRLVTTDTNGNVVTSPPDPSDELFFTTHEAFAIRRDRSGLGGRGRVRYSRR